MQSNAAPDEPRSRCRGRSLKNSFSKASGSNTSRGWNTLEALVSVIAGLIAGGRS